MEIKFLGHSSFEIKGAEAAVHIDGKNIVIEGASEPFTISGPGEYEVSGVRVFGIKSEKTILYLLEMDDLSLVHLGDLGRKLEHNEVEELNSVDVLMIPVGGVDTINAETAAEVVAQLEPYIVLPMHYRESEETKKFDPVEKFLEQMGEENVRREKKLKVTKSSLPEDTEVVVLERAK
jgi:L-ascorbate metabolism protein UlaG (beta-lactamase superfamily)